MKKAILLISSLFSFIPLFAQEEVAFGKFFIGGSANVLIQNNTYPSNTINSGIGGSGSVFSNINNEIQNSRFSLNTYLGRQIKEHFSVGTQLDFGYGKYSGEYQIFVFPGPQGNNISYENNSFQAGLGIFGRYVFNPANKLNFNMQPFLKYQYVKSSLKEDNITSREERSLFFETGVGMGALYQVSERFRISLNIGDVSYVSGTSKITGNDDFERDFSSLNMNFSLSRIFFGFEYLLK